MRVNRDASDRTGGRKSGKRSVVRFRTKSMAEALGVVRRELGPDAAILRTREVLRRRCFGLIRGETEIEITASSRSDDAPSRLPANDLRPDYDLPRVVEESTPGASAPFRRNVEPTESTGGDAMFEVFTDLIESDLDEDSARELLDRVRTTRPAPALDDATAIKEQVARLVESQLTIGGPIRIPAGGRRVAALVGPTGVGKTTTIAKLAANYRLREKRRVGFVTVDTYRIAAIEQLRTYAQIIDLPMEVASTPAEMREAVRRLADMELVLIDTAGRSPQDDVKIRELQAMLSEAAVDEVHLVLSAVASARTSRTTIERFAAAGTGSLILTKLDEAASIGHLYPVLRDSGMPVRYLTTGQNVPDDMETADSARLARLVLAMDRSRALG